MADIKSLEAEFRRAFRAEAEATDLGNGEARVWVEDWPDSVRYRIDTALRVLRGFEDGYGEDEAGDAEVCRTLDREGAFIDLDNG